MHEKGLFGLDIFRRNFVVSPNYEMITFIDPFCRIYRNPLYYNYDLLAVKRLFAKMESDY